MSFANLLGNSVAERQLLVGGWRVLGLLNSAPEECNNLLAAVARQFEAATQLGE
jgi:hypothetical protein